VNAKIYLVRDKYNLSTKTVDNSVDELL
jgi:hypothetical protein